MLNALVIPSAALGMPQRVSTLPLPPRRRLSFVKKDKRITARQFDENALQLPRRMKAENIRLARRVLVDGLSIPEAAKETGVTYQNGQAVVSRVRAFMARSLPEDQVLNEPWERVSLFAPPSLAKEIRATAKTHSLPVRKLGRDSTTMVEQSRRPERRERMTIAEFEAVKKKLPRRLQPSTIDVAYRVFVKGETMTEAAKACELTSPRVSAIVDRVLAAAEGAPPTWKRVDVLLPAKIAQGIKKRVEMEKRAIQKSDVKGD